ncbi:hypothetical protein ACFYXM_05545 [Streptomyces sp. NPDC002476]|uniref:hypothetical protein n=1 Tax=Streptomyces sp. NPDC002476 TaxID=3364648 RepID=UPI003678FD4E
MSGTHVARRVGKALFVPVLATALSHLLLAMPAVLWVGMRLLRERRVYPTLIVETVGWFFTVGQYIDRLNERPSMVMPLGMPAVFVAMTALSSVVLRPRSE